MLKQMKQYLTEAKSGFSYVNLRPLQQLDGQPTCSEPSWFAIPSRNGRSTMFNRQHSATWRSIASLSTATASIDGFNSPAADNNTHTDIQNKSTRRAHTKAKLWKYALVCNVGMYRIHLFIAISLLPCHIHSWFKRYKNYKNRLRQPGVIFYGPQCI